MLLPTGVVDGAGCWLLVVGLDWLIMLFYSYLGLGGLLGCVLVFAWFVIATIWCLFECCTLIWVGFVVLFIVV